MLLPKCYWLRNEFLTNHLITIHVPDVADVLREKLDEHPTEEQAIIEKMQLLTITQLRQLEPLLDAIQQSKEINYEIK